MFARMSGEGGGLRDLDRRASSWRNGIGEPHPDPLETRALGMVDELDDPSPGHMSEHPVALTSVTSSEGRHFMDTLETRFVRSQEEMTVDDDKENTKT